jgi:hypothetical protein
MVPGYLPYVGIEWVLADLHVEIEDHHGHSDFLRLIYILHHATMGNARVLIGSFEDDRAVVE